MMEIPGDDCTLNDEARRMADAFRLAANLFISRKDTETLIRRGMLEEARYGARLTGRKDCRKPASLKN
ncbi:MAG: hypothetical protein ACI4O7_13790 [Aristaeellaceae bacterium]